MLEKFKDTKGVIRCNKSKKERQHNDQKKTDKSPVPGVNRLTSIKCHGTDMIY